MSTSRFVPARAGIVNLYEYADQTFEFADGRLLLRGHNTSGKTKVLELLFPFCLDGDISPARLDPFAGTAKEMKWNLVGCVEQDTRVGYVWIEFERADGRGGIERITAGIGMKAWRDRPGVTRWYWILADRRVGEDVRLVRDDREPCSRADLVAALGDDGELLGTASEYRERLRERVFGFATADEYRVMLELMRQLRRPHLSKSLDPAGVAAMLASGLPAVDDALLRRLASGLEQLEALEAGLARIRANRTRLRSFHDRTYRAYAQALVRERGQALRSADAAARAAAEALREATARAEGLRDEEALLADEQATRQVQLTTLEGEERALVTSAAWASVAEVAQLGRSVQAERATAAAVRGAAIEAATELVAAEVELVTATAALEEAAAGAGERLDDVDAVARASGLAARVTALRDQLASGFAPVAWRDPCAISRMEHAPCSCAKASSGAQSEAPTPRLRERAPRWTPPPSASRRRGTCARSARRRCSERARSGLTRSRRGVARCASSCSILGRSPRSRTLRGRPGTFSRCSHQRPGLCAQGSRGSERHWRDRSPRTRLSESRSRTRHGASRTITTSRRGHRRGRAVRASAGRARRCGRR